jgi:hypothetical protein
MKGRILVSGFTLLLLVVLGALISSVSAKGTSKNRETRFKVRIENISNKDGYTASDGTRWPFALSPGLFVLDTKDVTLFTEGKGAPTNGLEMQAEDGNPSGLVSSLESYHHSAMLHGVFNMPVGAMRPGPIGPGAAYEFTFTASTKMKLNMVMMFGQSNDLFYAPEKPITLFNGKDEPLSGDITSRFFLYDAGTEVDQELGVGADQAPRQKAANTGASENGVVHKATEERAFYNRTAELFRITITPES